jgi:hypothetical protein
MAGPGPRLSSVTLVPDVSMVIEPPMPPSIFCTPSILATRLLEAYDVVAPDVAGWWLTEIARRAQP